jgi:hypothetical protein
VFDAIRAEVPADKPVGVKVSATDWIEGGWDVEQTIAFSRELKQRGVDWISVSSGGISPLQKIALGPGYQVPFTQAVKEAAGVNTVAVGLITRMAQVRRFLRDGPGSATTHQPYAVHGRQGSDMGCDRRKERIAEIPLRRDCGLGLPGRRIRIGLRYRLRYEQGPTFRIPRPSGHGGDVPSDVFRFSA